MRPSWTKSTFEDVVLPIETIDPTKTPAKRFQYVDVSSVSNDTFEIVEPSKLLGKDAPSRARRKIRTGDVIFATIRPTLKRIAIVTPDLDGEVCSTGYFVFRTRPFLDSRYLFYWLLTDKFLKAMEGLQTGASYPAVSDTQVRQQEIVYPSLPEQQRIVAILDKTFAELATASANAERNLRSARELFESYLDSKFIEAQQRWPACTLDNLCVFENGDRGKNYPSRSARTATGVPFINAGHLTEDGIDLENMDFIPRERFNLLSNGKIKTGDVLFCLRGSLGKYAPVGDLAEGAIASSLVIVRARERISQDFLLLYFGSRMCAGMIAKFSNGAAQPNLSARSLGEFDIPVPPELEQNCIVEGCKQLKAHAKELYSNYRAKLDKIAALKQSILQKAFSGELTSPPSQAIKEAAE